jgi:hypothetical protein
MASKPQETGSDVQRWLNLIAAYDKEFAAWEKRAGKINERYIDKKAQQRKTANFNILWSNVQTLIPAVFSRLPKPDVSRRFKDNDPVGRVAASLLERCLDFEVEHYGDYRNSLKNSVQDRFLGGRGTVWVRYEPHIKAVDQPEDGAMTTEDVDEAVEVIDYECAPVDYVHWRDFGHAVARTWEEVPTIWRKVYMGRNALVQRFGEEQGSKIPLDTRPEELKKSNYGADAVGNFQACIYEIWDKESGKAIWLSKSMGEILDQRDDPLGLEEFWPCPRPLFATLTSDSLVPTPDFALYQDQAESLDILSDRIDGLIKALQVKGVHDAAVPELVRLFSEANNNDLIPVKNWAAFAEKQGLKGAIDIVDLTPIVKALEVAYQAAEQVRNQVYEITGLSDIIRGTNDPAATATAEKIKGQFGTLRLRDMQKEVAQFAADILRIKAQIIAGKFQPDTIAMLGGAEQFSETDQPLIPQALELLKSAPLRAFRIDIEADSLVQMDEEAEKQARVEFLGAVGNFLKEALNAPPELAPLLGVLLKFGVTGFKVGKMVEGEIDQAIDQMKQKAANPPPQPPDPEMAKVQAQMQGKAQELQMQDQFNERQAQREMQLEQWKQQQQAAQVQHQNELEAQRSHLEQQQTAALEAMKQDNDRRIGEIQANVDILIARLNNAAKVEVAEIAAQTTLDAAQISSANQASGESE